MFSITPKTGLLSQNNKALKFLFPAGFLNSSYYTGTQNVIIWNETALDWTSISASSAGETLTFDINAFSFTSQIVVKLPNLINPSSNSQANVKVDLLSGLNTIEYGILNVIKHELIPSTMHKSALLYFTLKFIEPYPSSNSY